MTKETWIIACILSAMVLAGLGGLSIYQKSRALHGAQAELDKLRAMVERHRGQLVKLEDELAAHQAQVTELRKEKDAAAKAQKDLETEMRAALQSKDVTISELQGKLTVSILDRIMFDSGEAVLKPEGEKILLQVAQVLSQFPKRQIHVIGHTDNVPIRASARERFPSNWELSTLRATAAVRFLCEKGGVDPRQLGAVGYGEFHPMADNATAEGRAKNRRIALVVLSEELAGADAPAVRATIAKAPSTGATNAPTSETTSSTNPPAVFEAPAKPVESSSPPPAPQTTNHPPGNL